MGAMFLLGVVFGFLASAVMLVLFEPSAQDRADVEQLTISRCTDAAMAVSPAAAMRVSFVERKFRRKG